MKEKLQRLIDIATAEIGVRESGVNFVKYNDWYWGQGVGGTDYPWCVAFIEWCFDKAGIDIVRTAHCRDLRNDAMKKGRWVTSYYQVGDVFILPADKHTGLIVGIGEGGYVTTIEGNYGDKVTRVFRHTSEFAGAWRPDYGEDEPDILDEPITPVDETIDIPEAVDPAQDLTMYAREALQLLLEYRGYHTKSKKLSGRMDGEAGPGTDSALMQLQGSTKVTDDTWHKLIWGY